MGLLAAVAALGGCQGTPAEPPGPPDRRATPMPEEVAPPVVHQLGAEPGDLPRLRTALPSRLDVPGAGEARSLHDAPVAAAVLAAGTVSEPYESGDPAVLTSAGAWRIVDRDRLGMRDPAIVEQQFQVSPDGRHLALGDDGGIVVVRLSTATTTRVRVPLGDPVVHRWTTDGSGVVVSGRGHSVRRSWIVRIGGSRELREDQHPWYSAEDAHGRVVELVPNPMTPGAGPDPRPTAVRGVAGTAPLSQPLPRFVYVGGATASYVGVSRATFGRCRCTRGVQAIDPGTGRTVAVLHLPRSVARWIHVTDLVVDDRWLVVDLGTRGGSTVLAWDPDSGAVRNLMSTRMAAPWVSYAGQVVS